MDHPLVSKLIKDFAPDDIHATTGTTLSWDSGVILLVTRSENTLTFLLSVVRDKTSNTSRYEEKDFKLLKQQLRQLL